MLCPIHLCRARACNVLYTFSMVTYQDFSNVQTIMEAVLKCLQVCMMHPSRMTHPPTRGSSILHMTRPSTHNSSMLVR